MIGLLTVRVIWLGLMLTEQQNARYNSRHTARCRIRRPTKEAQMTAASWYQTVLLSLLTHFAVLPAPIFSTIQLSLSVILLQVYGKQRWLLQFITSLCKPNDQAHQDKLSDQGAPRLHMPCL